MKFILGLLVLAGTSLLTATPVVIAHRGASGYLPEHTLPAKAMAHAMHVDYIEQDVVLTKDNIPVVLHDVHIDTVSDVAQKFPKRKRADGRFYAIDFTLNELRTLAVTERFDYKTGERYFPKRFPARHSRFAIATLAEEIELIQGLNISTGREVGLYVEIKHPEFHEREKKDIAKITHLVLKEYGYEDRPYNKKTPRIYLQCFFPPTLKRLKNDIKTKIPLVQLIADNSWGESSTDYNALLTENGMQDIATYAVGIGPWMKQLLTDQGTPSAVMTYARKNKLKVHAYTARADQLPPGIKDFATLHHLLFKVVQIDGLFSDHADQSLDWIHKNFASGS